LKSEFGFQLEEILTVYSTSMSDRSDRVVVTTFISVIPFHEFNKNSIDSV
jgi:hypothetical protein